MDADNLKLDDVELMTALIMGEAEGEPLLGKLAVGLVVRNRLNDSRWPNTWRDVMLQPKQFSCFNEGHVRSSIYKKDWNNIYWKESKFAAFGVIQNYLRDFTKGANHYLATWLKPRPSWADESKFVYTVGGHLFYKL